MKRFISLLFFCFVTTFVYSQKSTNTSGGWSTAGNWTPNGVPASGNTITVGHNMTITQTITLNNNGSITINSPIIDPAGGSNYGFGLSNFAIATVDAYTEFGGSCIVQNSASLTIKGCDTLYIHGNVEFRDNCTITIESCAVLKIDGNLTMKNNNTATIDGVIDVGGDVTAINNAVAVGTGTVYAGGTITTNNSGSFFGSTGDCSTGPCEANQSNGVGGLPVELLDFSGSRFNNEVILYWSTASEINNDRFEIESSPDCINWKKVGYVVGWGNSNIIRNYKWVDDDPLYSYYRLKQIDFDGKYEYHKSIFLPTTSVESYDKTLNVNPNPISIDQNINIELNGFRGEEVLLILLDELGKEHYSKVVVAETDNEIFIISTDGKLPRGLYIIMGTSMNKLYNKHVLIK